MTLIALPEVGHVPFEEAPEASVKPVETVSGIRQRSRGPLTETASVDKACRAAGSRPSPSIPRGVDRTGDLSNSPDSAEV